MPCETAEIAEQIGVFLCLIFKNSPTRFARTGTIKNNPACSVLKYHSGVCHLPSYLKLSLSAFLYLFLSKQRKKGEVSQLRKGIYHHLGATHKCWLAPKRYSTNEEKVVYLQFAGKTLILHSLNPQRVKRLGRYQS